MPRTHKSLPRLYVEQPLAAGQSIPLERDQANHLLNVLRLKDGDSVVAFNGRDGAWLSRVSGASKKSASIEPVEIAAPQTPPSNLWFGFAPLKVGRLEYLVQKATEMGAGTIQPVITQYTQMRGLKPDKVRAWALEAAQQCEVLTVPTIAPEVSLRAIIEGWRQTQGSRRLVFADEAVASASPADRLRSLGDAPVGLLVGPEGGFSDTERELLLAQDFVVPISLGPRILRADTAAVAALAVIQATIGDWR